MNAKNKSASIAIVSFIFIIISLFFFSQALIADNISDYTVEKPLSGEHCIVLHKPLDSNDVVLIIDGQRIGVKRGCLKDFFKNKDKYLAQMQPRGALFDEQSGSDDAINVLNSFWFWISMYIFTCLMISGLTGYIAISRGLHVSKCVALGLIFNVVGLAIVLFQSRGKDVRNIPRGFGRRHKTYDPVICEGCGAELHPSATVCSGCGMKIKPMVKSEVENVVNDSIDGS